MSKPVLTARHHLHETARRLTNQHLIVTATYVLAMASVMMALHLSSVTANAVLVITALVGVTALRRIAEQGAVIFGVYVMASIGLGFGFDHLAVDAVLLTATMAGYAMGDVGITRLTDMTAGAR